MGTREEWEEAPLQSRSISCSSKAVKRIISSHPVRDTVTIVVVVVLIGLEDELANDPQL